MAPGFRTGGRPPGGRNKRTLALEEKIAAAGVDPIIALCAISQDEAHPIEVRVACLKELASFLHPKKKSVEVQSTTSVSVSLIDLVNQAMSARQARLENMKEIPHEK